MSRAFEKSYKQFETYRRNLIFKASYTGVLKAYEGRLGSTEPPFLIADSGEVEIHFRDWDDPEQRFSDYKIVGDDDLKIHLGEDTNGNPATVAQTTSFLKRDPKCRFIFLHAELSTKPLNHPPNS